jgi:hypothetical protein
MSGRLRWLVGRNVVRFYAAWAVIFVGGLVFLTGGLVASTALAILVLAVALVPTAVLSALAASLLTSSSGSTRPIVAVLSAALSYATTVAFSVVGNPPPEVAPIVVSPIYLPNLLAIMAGMAFAAFARFRTSR